jgi:hypothetical protein
MYLSHPLQPLFKSHLQKRVPSFSSVSQSGHGNSEDEVQDLLHGMSVLINALV